VSSTVSITAVGMSLEEEMQELNKKLFNETAYINPARTIHCLIETDVTNLENQVSIINNHNTIGSDQYCN
jgi:hypothetical protein